MYKAVPGGTIDSVINDIDNRNVDGPLLPVAHLRHGLLHLGRHSTFQHHYGPHAWCIWVSQSETELACTLPSG